MYGAPIMTSKKESEFKFPEGFPEEIKDELLASRCNLRIDVSMNSDEQIVGHFSYSHEDDYGNYEKSFNSWKEFNDHAAKFFSIQDIYEKHKKKGK